MKIKNILWDFDGVILDSMAVRDYGFRAIFNDFDETKVERLIQFHKNNGGLSRYVKIRHFFEVILGEKISEKVVLQYANTFSTLMKERLCDKNNLIKETIDFIERHHKGYRFHIVSGSDGEELRYLCNCLKIDHFFFTIEGSPTPKNELVKDILFKNSYETENTCLIGDSINDYEAALVNNISFYGYNSNILKEKCENYINSFDTFTI